MSRTTIIKPVTEVTEQREIRQLRKGVPDEYKELLVKGKADTGIKIEKAKEEAIDGAKEEVAKIYVPKLYKILIKHNYTPKSARVIITNDCVKSWTQRHVMLYMPEETKDLKKVLAGKTGRVNQKEKREKEDSLILEQLEQIFPDIKKEDKDTQNHAIKMANGMGSPKVTSASKTRVATLGGEAKRDKYGNEVFSDMGLKGMDVRWHKQQTFELAIEDEEHAEIIKAYRQSQDKRQNNTGGYTIFVKDGGFDHVEPSNGMPEKSVNK